MKLLLPVRDGIENMELLYALRSWEKNLHIPDLELIVVGNVLPRWLKPDDIIIGNMWGTSQRNVYHNIKTGCAELAKEDEIIVMNDDFFVLDPVREIIPTYRSTLAHHIRKSPGQSWWSESLRNTAAYIEKVGGVAEPLSYDLHRPCTVIPRHMELILSRAEDFSPQNPPQWRTLYGNLHSHWKDAVQARDAKAVRATSIPIGVPFVSTDDQKWRQYWGRVISPLFPEPSRWEIRD